MWLRNIGFLQRNLNFKILSLCLAVALWLYLHAGDPRDGRRPGAAPGTTSADLPTLRAISPRPSSGWYPGNRVPEMVGSEVEEARLPVKVEYTGAFRNGVVPGRARVNPATVLVRGQRRVVTSLKEVKVSVDLTDLEMERVQEAVVVEAPVALPDGPIVSGDSRGNITIKPAFVRVTVTPDPPGGNH